MDLSAEDMQKLDKLPPDVRQKFEEAISRLKNNPNPFAVISALGSLAKTAKTMGITRVSDPEALKLLSTIKNKMGENSTDSTTTITSSANPGSAATPSTSNPLAINTNLHAYARENSRRNITPTFNPDVKGDHKRAKIAILGILIIVGYLVFHYILNDQVPQEIIDFLNS